METMNPSQLKILTLVLQMGCNIRAFHCYNLIIVLYAFGMLCHAVPFNSVHRWNPNWYYKSDSE